MVPIGARECASPMAKELALHQFRSGIAPQLTDSSGRSALVLVRCMCGGDPAPCPSRFRREGTRNRSWPCQAGDFLFQLDHQPAFADQFVETLPTFGLSR